MIERALPIGGCSVSECPADLAGVMEIRAHVITSTLGALTRLLQVPLCAQHVAEMRDSEAHPVALIDSRPARFYRALIVEPRLVINGEPYR